MGRAHEVRKKAMAVTNAAKTKLYAKYGKEIYIAAKNGVPDPAMNLTLKRVIERAKKDQVTADLIKRAIDKAKSGTNESYTAVTYEGFGPGASTFIVECLTDNVNRSISSVRSYFTKVHGKLGVGACVSHEYTHCCIISFKGIDADTTLLTLLEAGIEVNDIEQEDDVVSVFGEPNQLYLIKDALEKNVPNIVFEDERITWIPPQYITLQDPLDVEKFERLINALDEDDDVQDVYHNVAN